MSLTLPRTTLLGVAAVCTVLLSACTTAPSTAPSTAPDESAIASGYPSGHIHGMSVDPTTSRVLLATHDGLFDVTQSPAQQVGPTIDLMGFTSTTDGTLYASGHPGPGTDLPNPVGLITSTDDGHTWKAVSRQGETDFHALAATDDGIVGHEGRMLTSPDGHHWTITEDDIPAYNLAGAFNGTVLATTEDGLHRSEDSGATWSVVPDAPLLIFTALVGSTAVGITPDGTVHTSADGGQTWQRRGSLDDEPAAIAAVKTDEDPLRIWVATQNGIQVSTDSGMTFSPS